MHERRILNVWNVALTRLARFFKDFNNKYRENNFFTLLFLQVSRWSLELSLIIFEMMNDKVSDNFSLQFKFAFKEIFSMISNILIH